MAYLFRNIKKRHVYSKATKWKRRVQKNIFNMRRENSELEKKEKKKKRSAGIMNGVRGF